MSRARRIPILLLVILTGVVTAGAGDDKPKSKAPLSEAALVRLAKSGLEEEVIVAVVKSRGISFNADDATRKRLKEAGVPESVLAVLPAGKIAANPEPEKEGAKPGPGATDGPLASARHSKGLIVEVLEAKFDDDKPLITIRWRYRNPTKRPIELIAATPRFGGTPGRPIERFWSGVYYLEGDKEDTTAYRCSVVTDTGGKRWASDLGRAAVVVKPEEEVEMWAKFERPIAAVKKISFHVLDTPPLENVPLPRRAAR